MRKVGVTVGILVGVRVPDGGEVDVAAGCVVGVQVGISVGPDGVAVSKLMGNRLARVGAGNGL